MAGKAGGIPCVSAVGTENSCEFGAADSARSDGESSGNCEVGEPFGRDALLAGRPQDRDSRFEVRRDDRLVEPTSSAAKE